MAIIETLRTLYLVTLHWLISTMNEVIEQTADQPTRTRIRTKNCLITRVFNSLIQNTGEK